MKLSIDNIVLVPKYIINGKKHWTIITSIFMYGGFFHAFIILFFHYYIGSISEKILGKKSYLFFYSFSGVFSNLFYIGSAFFFPSLLEKRVTGASAILAAVVSILIIVGPNIKVKTIFLPIPQTIESIKLKYIGLVLLLVVLVFPQFVDINIGTIGHIGGVVSGIIFGTILRLKNWYNNIYF